MKPIQKTALILLFISVCLSAKPDAADALDVTLAWDPSTSTVDGYRVHYKADDQGGPPYDGTGALEGNSPVTVGKATGFTLHGLDPGRIYYFAVTAYIGGLESGYSNEVSFNAQGPIIKSIKIK